MSYKPVLKIKKGYSYGIFSSVSMLMLWIYLKYIYADSVTNVFDPILYIGILGSVIVSIFGSKFIFYDDNLMVTDPLLLNIYRYKIRYSNMVTIDFLVGQFSTWIMKISYYDKNGIFRTRHFETMKYIDEDILNLLKEQILIKQYIPEDFLDVYFKYKKKRNRSLLQHTFNVNSQHTFLINENNKKIFQDAKYKIDTVSDVQQIVSHYTTKGDVAKIIFEPIVGCADLFENKKLYSLYKLTLVNVDVKDGKTCIVLKPEKEHYRSGYISVFGIAAKIYFRDLSEIMHKMS